MNFVGFEERDKRELEEMRIYVVLRVCEVFNEKNLVFKVDLVKVYEVFKRDIFEYVSNFLVYIKRKNVFDNFIRNGGDVNNKMVFFLE